MPADDRNYPIRPARRIVDAYARHGYGSNGYGGTEATTFVYADAEHRQPIGWLNGHAEPGSLWEVEHHGRNYRLNIRSPIPRPSFFGVACAIAQAGVSQ